jgi:hypothetical protein
VDDPTGADRSASIVLGAAVIAMGLLAGLYGKGQEASERVHDMGVRGHRHLRRRSPES